MGCHLGTHKLDVAGLNWQDGRCGVSHRGTFALPPRPCPAMCLFLDCHTVSLCHPQPLLVPGAKLLEWFLLFSHFFLEHICSTQQSHSS